MQLLTAPLFGSKHLIGILFITVFFILISTLIKKDKAQDHNKFILIFMIAFYVLEILKIGYIIYLDKAYPIYQLPFHLCSIPLYLYPLMYFFKNTKFVDKFIKPASYSLVLIAGIMALALPTNILGSQVNWLPLKDNILPIISFFYHGLMIFSSIYLLKSKYYRFQLTDYTRSMTVGLTFAGIAIIVNQLLDKDFMLLNKGTGSPLAFILEISKPLYMVSMIGGFAILIGIIFVVTDVVYSKKKVNKIAKTSV
jgi:uncharacterized membrane protein YwaF